MKFMKTQSMLDSTPDALVQTRSSRLRILSALLVGLSSVWMTHAQAPSVATDHTAYLPGEDIVATFKNGPGNPKDWVGIYGEGQTPGSIGSTLWYYVNNSQTAGEGHTEGQITFTGGLNLAGNWDIYLFVNDGYTKIATNTFMVVDPSSPLVRTDKRAYTPGEPITANFSNGPANPKDWIGIYPTGITPGTGPASTLWVYVDGTDTGTTGKSEGAVTFTTGLPTLGSYMVYLLENDGYTALASEPFTVAEPASTGPRVLWVYPRNGATDLPPVWDFLASITNGLTQVAPGSVALTIDGATVIHQYTEQAGLVSVAYTNETLLAPNSLHTYQLLFKDNGTPASTTTNQGSFTVAPYRNIVLPNPLFFESFDSTPEGQLPAGWTQTNFTDISASDSTVDFGNLDSAAYESWTVVNADRFANSFVTYSNPDRTTLDYLAVLAVNPRNVVNGKFLWRLTTGRLAFGDSGYRNGSGQLMYLFSPDFNLSGKSNVFLSYHSLWHQNQDSMGSVEYSIDQGLHWLPVVYMLDDQNQSADVIRLSDGTTDAVTTMTTNHTDLPLFTNPDTGEEMGGYYGAYIGAPVTQDLAPFISGRINDDSVESKRVELFRLAGADRQANVRFRFAHIGSDSWYFGIDDFGLYSITAPEGPVTLKVSLSGTTLTFTWTGGGGSYQLQKATSLTTPSWQNVGPSTTATTASDTLAAGPGFYRLLVQ